MLAASVKIIAIARSASSQTCFRRRAVCKLSEPVAACAERTADVAQVVRRWRWYDGSIVETTKIDLTRSTNFPKIVSLLRNQISLFLLDCQPICVDRRVRPGRHLLHQATRQPHTISHRCRQGPVFPSALVYETLRPRQTFPPALPQAPHRGRAVQRGLQILRRMLQMASRHWPWVPSPARCARLGCVAASPPATSPGPRLTRSCCCDRHCRPASVRFLVDKVVPAEDFRFHRTSPLLGSLVQRGAHHGVRVFPLPALTQHAWQLSVARGSPRRAHRCNPREPGRLA